MFGLSIYTLDDANERSLLMSFDRLAACFFCTSVFVHARLSPIIFENCSPFSRLLNCWSSSLRVGRLRGSRRTHEDVRLENAAAPHSNCC